jgi:hypothetical protein
MNSRATLNNNTKYDISTKERKSARGINKVFFKDITTTKLYTLLQQKQQRMDNLR